MEWGDAGDEVVVLALRDGDEGAFTWLLTRYDRSLRHVARGLVGSDAVAAEVVQETWLAVVRGLDGFEGRSSLRTWIFRILHHVAGARRRSEGRTVPFSALARIGDAGDEPAFPDEWFLPAGHEYAGWWAAHPRPWDPPDRYDDRQLLEVVRRAIADLPDAQRVVISLRDIDGWTSAEVCDALGISAANQRVLLHRARSKVRAALDPLLVVADS